METLQEFSSSSPTFLHPEHTLAHKCYKFLQCKSLMTDVNIVYRSDQKLQSSLVSNLKHTHTHAHTPPLSNTLESSSLSPQSCMNDSALTAPAGQTLQGLLCPCSVNMTLTERRSFALILPPWFILTLQLFGTEPSSRPVQSQPKIFSNVSCLLLFCCVFKPYFDNPNILECSSNFACTSELVEKNVKECIIHILHLQNLSFNYVLFSS